MSFQEIEQTPPLPIHPIDFNSDNPNGSLEVKRGDTVEGTDGDFLLVEEIDLDTRGCTVALHGHLLRRVTELEGRILGDKTNEVCFIHEQILEHHGSVHEQSRVTIPWSKFYRIRHLIRTNKPWKPLFKRAETPGGSLEEKLEYIRENEVLVARWTVVTIWYSAWHKRNVDKARFKYGPKEKLILPLKDSECSIGEFVSADTLKYQWRQETLLGGSGNETWRYTFADLFCGAGGVSCGAKRAKLQVQYGLDKAAHVRETWEHNFPEGTFINNSAEEFLLENDPRKELKVDILHLSPPCQPFSKGHTTKGRNDAENEAPMRLISSLIKKTTPRIVTLEESDTFLDSSSRDLLGATINSFTKLGFGVRFKYMAFENLGLPQSRHRLFIIAACPGETLPPFPDYTHSDDPRKNLRPFVSTRDALASIPPHAPNNKTRKPNRNGRYPRWNDTKIIRTIKTNGGNDNFRTHPTLRRAFTHRETATLQGFPHDFEFKGLKIVPQIGNAVPPLIAKSILENVVEHLKGVDKAILGQVKGLVFED